MAKVKISTTMGDITVRLYDETPLHRDNFLKLASESFFNGTLFHRVIKDFMIQGGDPESKELDAPSFTPEQTEAYTTLGGTPFLVGVTLCSVK